MSVGLHVFDGGVLCAGLHYVGFRSYGDVQLCVLLAFCRGTARATPVAGPDVNRTMLF